MDKFKKYILPILVLIIAVVCSVLTTKSCSKVEERVVTITDTITNVKFDTVFLKEVKVERLKTTDTLNQIVYRDSLVVDSVFVEIPISTYEVNKIFENDSSDLKLHLMMSGYNVSLDTLSYSLKYKYKTVQLQKPKHRLAFFVGPVVGFGVEPTGKVVPTVGFGVGVGISLKKL